MTFSSLEYSFNASRSQRLPGWDDEAIYDAMHVRVASCGRCESQAHHPTGHEDNREGENGLELYDDGNWR
ncbi:hypothetical protein PV325_012645, partial [Microctonus aethiopoides]